MSIYQYYISSLVQFTETDIRVFVMSDSETTDQKTYAYCLLVSEYLVRLYTTIKTDQNAHTMLMETINEPKGLREKLDTLLRGYKRRYKIDDVQILYNLSSKRPERGCGLVIGHDFEGEYAPDFRPYGFSSSGKSLESATLIACLASIQFLINENSENEDAIDAMFHTIGLVRQHLETSPEVSAGGTVGIVGSVMETVSRDYGFSLAD